MGRALAALVALSFCACAEPPRPNLLLVCVDTLRADRLGAYGYERDTSPELDAFAESAVLFESARVTSSWTLPSLASVLTSQYPSTHGCWSFDSALDPSFVSVAEVLRDAGWETAGIASHVFLAEKHGLQQGFDEFDSELITESMFDSHERVSSPQVTEKALAWLRGRGEAPWFLWLHYFDPHATYLAHEGVSERFGSSDSDLYDGEVAFTDAHLGRVFGALDELGLADDTIVVFFADHGEAFGEHGEIWHGLDLYGEAVRVPFLIRAPGFAPARVEHAVRLVDLVPTLLELLDLESPVPLAGRSLVPILRGEELPVLPALAELRLYDGYHADALVRGRWKYVKNRSKGTEELYDLESDPGERANLAGARPEVVLRLRDDLTELVELAERAGRLYSQAGSVDLADDELQALRDLGYVDGR